MKKFFISSLFFLTIFSTSTAHADTKTVTINWSTSGSTSEILSYKMLYSYSNDMSNPQVACETNDTFTNSLTCENVQFTSSEVYFRIVATSLDTATNSNIQSAVLPLNSLTAVQGFTILSQDTPPTSDIYDNFSIDTTSNFITFENSFSVSEGKLHGQIWRKSVGYHTTSLNSTNHIVSAECTFSTSDASGLALRVNPTDKSGYMAIIKTEKIELWKFYNSTQRSWVAESSRPFTSPATLQVEISGTNIIVKVNDIEQINITDNSYSSGTYCGVVIDRGYSATDITLDNFSGTSK